ncbi:MAG: hypothetical protein WC621_05365 [Patescibacteria group bacterium]
MLSQQEIISNPTELAQLKASYPSWLRLIIDTWDGGLKIALGFFLPPILSVLTYLMLGLDNLPNGTDRFGYFMVGWVIYFITLALTLGVADYYFFTRYQMSGQIHQPLKVILLAIRRFFINIINVDGDMADDLTGLEVHDMDPD